MSEFNRTGGPFPTENRSQAQRDHEQELLVEAEHAHEVKEATRARRRRWWPFGRRRAR